MTILLLLMALLLPFLSLPHYPRYLTTSLILAALISYQLTRLCTPLSPTSSLYTSLWYSITHLLDIVLLLQRRPANHALVPHFRRLCSGSTTSLYLF